MRLQLTAVALAPVLLLVPRPAAADPDVTVAGDTLFYSDDDRVIVLTPQASARMTLDTEGTEVGAHVIIDVVSAASVDVVSQATDRFEETRVELGVHGAYALGRRWLPSLALRYSTEEDYRSFGGRIGSSLRAGGDTTVEATYDLSLDTVGRAETSFRDWSEELAVHTLQAGVTQNLGPRTVVRVVGTVAVQEGYLAKPYRYVPLFDMAGLERAADDGVTLGLHTFDDYRLAIRPPENVPDRRVRVALFGRALRWLGRAGAGRADYRLYGDGWGMTAHTVELGWQLPIAGGVTAELRERFHVQSSVNFWRKLYVVDDPDSLPRYRTLDRELSAYLASTTSAGATWRHDAFTAYGELGVMVTRFNDFLLLDRRLALIAQLGVRWSP
jgi:hypothetical protein